MVFLIQNTQNRDSKAIHLKLDELIKSTRTARNEMLNIEDMPDSDLQKMQDEFKKLHERYEIEIIRRAQKKLQQKKTTDQT